MKRLIFLIAACVALVGIATQSAHSQTTNHVITVHEYLQKTGADSQYDWKQAINFYGKVVDQSNAPVANANVSFEWTDLSRKGTSEAGVKSDGNGFFSLLNRTGKRLIVHVSKDGYYSSKGSVGSFEYANPGNGLFIPDRANPVVFHLYRRGEGAELGVTKTKITVGVGKVASLSLDKLTTLKVELLTNAPISQRQWAARVRVENGGIQLALDDFPYEAPSDGYKPEMELNRDTPKPSTWEGSLYQGGQFYIKTATGYGRLELKTVSGKTFMEINAWLNPTGSRNLDSTPASEPQALTPGASNLTSQAQNGAPQRAPQITEEGKRYLEHIKSDPLYDWKQPINFYGSVLDESNRPVAGATVSFEWNDLSRNGSSKKQCVSDANGLFAIHEKGKVMCITVNKTDYYSTRDARSVCFEFASPFEPLFIKTDKQKPVVFHLRKKGDGVDLIVSQFGLSSEFRISIPRNGTPVKLNVLQQKLGDNGQIEFSQIKPEANAWKEATSWSFKMTIPDGGFVECNDEFLFQAPESGYQPVVDFQFQKDNTNWTELIRKKFYIKFGSPPRYGRLQINTIIDSGGAFLDYAINPSGSRDLEPK